MNTLLLALIAAGLVVLIALMLRPESEGEATPGDREAEDARVSPLLRGINYLLSDEPDLALREMVQVARLRSEAAEVYMALGEMFLNRGEIGRAVRIHQNLLARPDLPEAMRIQVQMALGRDFQTGGLLDRALRQYRKVLEAKPDHLEALQASLRIREASQEWEEAEALLSRIEQVTGESRHSHRAYLFAEMAAEAFESDPDAAQERLRRALELDPACGLARVLAVRCALHSGDGAAIEQAVRDCWTHAREHLPLLVPDLLEDAHRAAHETLLEALWREYRDEGLALAWIEAVAERDGRAAARELAQKLGYVPGSLRAMLRLEAATGEAGDPRTEHASRWRAGALNFVCAQCGVGVAEMRWQCPQCHAWGTMHPKVEEAV
ncbi:MAG: heat-shock protein [Mariprofundaceae bacterium]